jgi:hypothetical protein
MKVSSKSWHFKLAQYGGMKHFYGLPYPTICKYISYIFSGVIWGIIEKLIYQWVIPLIVDFGLIYIFYALFNKVDIQPQIFLFFMFVYIIYFYITVNIYLDIGVYYGPLFVLRRFTVVTKFINKFCGKVEIVYEKE